VEELLEELVENNDTASGQDKRETAIRALGQLNHPLAVEALLPLLADDHGHIRELTEVVIVGAGSDRYYPGIRDAAAIEALVEKGLTDRNEEVRIGTARCLERMATDEHVGETVRSHGARMIEIGADDRADAAKVAIFEAASVTGATVPERAMRDIERGLREEAIAPGVITLLSRLGADDEVDYDRIFRNGPMTQVATIDEFARRRDDRLPTYIARAFDRRGTVEAKIAAVEALPVMKVIDADIMLEAFAMALNDDSWRVRVTAMHTALHIWMKELIGPLVERLAEEEGRLRLDCWMVLRILTDQSFGLSPELWATWWRANDDRFELEHTQPEPEEYGGWDFTRLMDAAGSGDTVVYFDIPLLSNALLFAFDPSDSMGNTDAAIRTGQRRIDYAADQAQEALAALSNEALFNVLLWEYPSVIPPRPTPQTAFRRMTPNTPGAARTANEWIKVYQPGGWGDFFGALTHAFADEEVDTVIFLSDGGASRGRYIRTPEFMPNLREANRFRRVAVHTILIGDDEREFMRAIANTTGGFFSQPRD